MDALQHRRQGIDGVYVDGISITSRSSRKHVWTYAELGVTNYFVT